MKDIITFAVLILALVCTAYLATKSDTRTALFEGKTVIRLAQGVNGVPQAPAPPPAALPAAIAPSR